MSTTAAAATHASRSLWLRMLRAAKLDAQLFEEVEAERASISQAVLVVLLASTAGALGARLAGATPLHIAVDFSEPLVFWIVGSAFSYMLGATFLRGPHTATDYAEVLRTTGFAFAPGLLRLGAAIPPPTLGFALTVAADLWVLVAGIVAVRQALDFSTTRAVLTFGIGTVLLWLTLGGVIFSLPV
jgi:hypothetical protein